MASRTSDEQILEMIHLRKRGWSLSRIEQSFGMAQGTAALKTNGVRRCDIAESGEDPEQVRKAYWA